jgi:hypothetical protein
LEGKLIPKESVIDEHVGTSEETKQILKPPSNPTELENKLPLKEAALTLPPLHEMPPPMAKMSTRRWNNPGLSMVSQESPKKHVSKVKLK